MTKSPKRISVILLQLMLFFSLLLTNGCGIRSPLWYPTATPVTPSPTPRICPPNTKLQNGDELKTTPTLFIFIYDQNSTMNGSGLEFSDGKTTQDPLKFINQIIPDLLGPGDEYSLFKFGYHGNDGYSISRVGGYQSRLPNSPAILSTPMPYLTATPYPSPDVESLPALERLQKLNEYNNIVATQTSEIEQNLFEQNCLEVNYNASIHSTATLWSATKQSEVIEITTKIASDQSTKNGEETPTTFPEVYNGLTYVSFDFQYLCKKYVKCFLIMISNLDDWRNESESSTIPHDLNIQLKNVDLIAVLPECDTIQDPTCQAVKNRWDKKFTTFGAISTNYFNGVRLEDNLVSYINQLRNTTPTPTITSPLVNQTTPTLTITPSPTQ